MEFNEFHEWVHRELGLNLKAYKQEQLNRRILSLMSRSKIESLDEYVKVLKTNSEERQKFLDFITINVTEFFRNPELFNEFEVLVKRHLIKGTNRLKIWSAACSIGCEPYSLAIMLKRISPDIRHKILATDIDQTILTRARRGEYTATEIKNIKSEELNKYFSKVNDKYFMDNSIKQMVEFRKHDLILDKYESDFDIILCRNVVIYFKNETKSNIYAKFSESLKKGGLLFVGATESIYNYKQYGFEKISTFVYKKL